MRLRLLLVAVAAGLAIPSASATTAKIVHFRTPSKNIACAYSPAEFGHAATLRCDILSGLKPQPQKRCELDWVGAVMTRRGKAHPLCAGDTVHDKRAPILRYGQTWKHRGFGCRSRRIGLKCRNRAGHGFFLSRQRWRTW
jgi:hypothetical protein